MSDTFRLNKVTWTTTKVRFCYFPVKYHFSGTWLWGFSTCLPLVAIFLIKRRARSKTKTPPTVWSTRTERRHEEPPSRSASPTIWNSAGTTHEGGISTIAPFWQRQHISGLALRYSLFALRIIPGDGWKAKLLSILFFLILLFDIL